MHTSGSVLHDVLQCAPLPKSETHGVSSEHATVQILSIEEHPLASMTDSVRHCVPATHDTFEPLHEPPA